MVKPKDVDGFDESVDFDNEDLRKFFSVSTTCSHATGDFPCSLCGAPTPPADRLRAAGVRLRSTLHPP